MKKQTKQQKIKKMLNKANLKNLKIIFLKNFNTKTKYLSKENILFVNPLVKELVWQILKAQNFDFSLL